LFFGALPHTRRRSDFRFPFSFVLSCVREPQTRPQGAHGAWWNVKKPILASSKRTLAHCSLAIAIAGAGPLSGTFRCLLLFFFFFFYYYLFNYRSMAL
jgi:hypothetical protein